MNQSLPLEALRTFVAAARHESFAQAAAQLNLTPSAVSHQMRKLEEALGMALFEREGRSVRLTVSGASFRKAVEPSLRSINEAAMRLRDDDGMQGPLVIACSSMFANRVLSRHLGRFVEDYPLVECTVISLENEAVLEEKSADLCILSGPNAWPDKWSIELGRLRFAPVCSPSFFGGTAKLPSDPAELMDSVIIHIDDGEEWRRWNKAAGLGANVRPRREIFTNDVGFALEIAAGGGGISLSSDLIAASYLESGRLIRPFATSIDVSGAWHLIAGYDKLAVKRVPAFIRWLAERLQLEEPQFA